MQIWVYPDRLANMGLTVKDLQDALKDQEPESAAGELGKQPVLDVDVTLPITAQDVVHRRSLRISGGEPGWLDRRMSDMARPSLRLPRILRSGINGKNAILGIYMLPGSERSRGRQ